MAIKEGWIDFSESPDGLPRLVGSRCRECGYTCFPRKVVCVRCRREGTMEELKLSRHVTLETYAVMRVGSPDFPPPYVMGYVRTKEGARLFSTITGCEAVDDALAIGQEMELVIETIRKDEEGNDLHRWKFKPVKERS